MSDCASHMSDQQHKVTRKINIFPGDIVMAKLHVPIANSNKLSPKFTGPYKIIEVATENEFYIQNLETGEISIRYVNYLKKAYMTDIKY